MTLQTYVEDLEDAAALLVDWDGCVMQNGRLLPGADAFLWRYEQKTLILSNNSTDLPRHITQILSQSGVNIPAHRILLAGQQAVEYVARTHVGQRVFMLASQEMRAYAATQGLNLVGRDADVVLLLRDLEFSYTKLRAAANMVRAGAPLVVANPDKTHPTDNGVAPETGALLAAIEACAGDVAPVIIGKPSPALFTYALKRMGVTADQAVMIGDNPLTDIAGASLLGLRSILIDPAQGVSLAALIEAVRAEKRLHPAARRA